MSSKQKETRKLADKIVDTVHKKEYSYGQVLTALHHVFVEIHVAAMKDYGKDEKEFHEEMARWLVLHTEAMTEAWDKE